MTRWSAWFVREVRLGGEEFTELVDHDEQMRERFEIELTVLSKALADDAL
ncbi:hypothetical protein ACGFY7_26400 [Streptomyces prunicolor]